MSPNDLPRPPVDDVPPLGAADAMPEDHNEPGLLVPELEPGEFNTPKPLAEDEPQGEAPMKTASFVKRRDGHGEGRVYELDPPMSYEGREIPVVWVSAVVAPYTGPETYIFEADRDGAVIDWGELPGSYQGGLDHAVALLGAGYEVTVDHD